MHASFFDKLSYLLMETGRAAPIHAELCFLYTESTVLQNLMAEYMIRIVNICQKSVLFASKTTLSQIATATLSGFDSEFGNLASELTSIGSIIEKHVQFLMAKGQKAVVENSSRTWSMISKLSEKAQRAQRTARQEMSFHLFKSLCED